MDHERMNGDYGWIRIKGEEKLVPGYFDGERFQVVGSRKIYPKSMMRNFIRLKYPEFAIG